MRFGVTRPLAVLNTVLLKSDATSWNTEVLDAQGDAGYAAQIELISDTQFLVAHVAIDNDAGKSFVRAALTLTDSAMTTFSRPYWRYIPAESDDHLRRPFGALEIEMVGSTTQLTFWLPNWCAGVMGGKTKQRRPFSEASFSNFRNFRCNPDSDPGHNPSAVALSNGSFAGHNRPCKKRGRFTRGRQ